MFILGNFYSLNIVLKFSNMRMRWNVRHLSWLLRSYNWWLFLALLSFTVLFLGITTFVEFLCTLLYAFFFPKLPIVKFYRSKAALEGSQTVSADLAVVGIKTEQNEEVWQFFFLPTSKMFSHSNFEILVSEKLLNSCRMVMILSNRSGWAINNYSSKT